MIDNLEVPKPPGIAALPTDERGVVIAAHVPRPGGAPRITEVDPGRLLILAVERRCSLCAWEFQPGERFWYVTWPQYLQQIQESGWKHWDVSLEGGAHEECLLYAAIVCPFLATPNYARRTNQRAGRTVVFERGTTRAAPTLAGAPKMEVSPPEAPDASYVVVLGGGPLALRHYNEGSELLPALREQLLNKTRTPTSGDLTAAQLMAEGTKAEIGVRVQHAWVVLAGREGLPPPPLGRNERCSCGLEAKFKHCCLPRYHAARVQRQ